MAFGASADAMEGFMFDPKYHLAAGGADHNVYIYDLRKATAPVLLLRSHSKAVSYTKFLSNNKQLVTAYDTALPLQINKSNQISLLYDIIDRVDCNVSFLCNTA